MDTRQSVKSSSGSSSEILSKVVDTLLKGINKFLEFEGSEKFAKDIKHEDVVDQDGNEGKRVSYNGVINTRNNVQGNVVVEVYPLMEGFIENEGPVEEDESSSSSSEKYYMYIDVSKVNMVSKPWPKNGKVIKIEEYDDIIKKFFSDNNLKSAALDNEYRNRSRENSTQSQQESSDTDDAQVENCAHIKLHLRRISGSSDIDVLKFESNLDDNATYSIIDELVDNDDFYYSIPEDGCAYFVVDEGADDFNVERSTLSAEIDNVIEALQNGVPSVELINMLESLKNFDIEDSSIK